MSIHIKALRDIAANGGFSVCDEVADELEDNEKAYALLFAENAKIRSMADIIPGLVKALQDAVNNPNDDAYWIKQATDAIAAAEGEKYDD